MKVFQIGETIPITVYTYNSDDELINQDFVVITINDSNGTEILEETAMINSATGTYMYNYNSSTSTTGIWTVKVKSTSGTIYNIENNQFKVVPAI